MEGKEAYGYKIQYSIALKFRLRNRGVNCLQVRLLCLPLDTTLLKEQFWKKQWFIDAQWKRKTIPYSIDKLQIGGKFFVILTMKFMKVK
jgi:hypothetical protein